jgi:hypothetical protein
MIIYKIFVDSLDFYYTELQLKTFLFYENYFYNVKKMIDV